MKATAQDMQDVIDFAEKRGIRAKFWDPQKRYLILTREEDAAEAGGGVVNGSAAGPEAGDEGKD